METQKEAWNNEIKQGIEALRSRLNDDRLALEKLRAQQLQEKARPRVGAVNITIDKAGDLKGPLTVKVGDETRLKLDNVPAKFSVNNIAAGLQTLHVTASRAAGQSNFDYIVTVDIGAGEIEVLEIQVT
jgi:hypothetical protein